MSSVRFGQYQYAASTLGKGGEQVHYTGFSLPDPEEGGDRPMFLLISDTGRKERDTFEVAVYAVVPGAARSQSYGSVSINRWTGEPLPAQANLLTEHLPPGVLERLVEDARTSLIVPRQILGKPTLFSMLARAVALSRAAE